MQHRPILIKGGTVVTLEGADSGGRDADVLVTGGRIEAIAQRIDIEDAQVIDATGMLVMPGFVDTHRHTWQTAFRVSAATGRSRSTPRACMAFSSRTTRPRTSTSAT